MCLMLITSGAAVLPDAVVVTNTVTLCGLVANTVCTGSVGTDRNEGKETQDQVNSLLHWFSSCVFMVKEKL